MENASKALAIAGSILLALVITALLVRTFTSISQYQQVKLTEEEQEKLVAFNEQYTKYLNQYVYGIEVRTLMNRYANDGIVQVIIEGTEPPSNVGQDTKYYKCTSIGYDDSMGRVNSITFKEVVLASSESSEE